MFKLQGGKPDEIPEVYKARSPLYHADKIQAPLLVSCPLTQSLIFPHNSAQILQGDADVAVPPAQAESIVKSIRANGGRVDYVLFPGEGHGWRKAGTIKAALEKEMTFARDIFGLDSTG